MKRFYSLILLFIILISSVDALTTTDGKFDYTINSDGETVTLTGGRSRDLPASIEGMPVTIIGSRAFENSSLWSQNSSPLVIPSSVITIGSRAFYNVGNGSLTIPNSVVTIGSYAFFGSRISSLTIPNSVVTIQNRAFGSNQFLQTVSGGSYVESMGSFFGCKRLKSFYIGPNVSSVDSQMFSICHDLQTLTVSSRNPNFSAIGTVLFSKDYSVLISAPSTSGHYTIPDTVHTVEDYAFQNQNHFNNFIPGYGLTGVTIPSSVTSIGAGAFSNQLLTSVTVPSSVTSIGSSAFSGNDSLSTAEIYSAVIGSGMFSSCANLTSVTINSSVTAIGSSAFSSCNNLTSITIPGSVTSIGNSAFINCSLTSLTLPKNLLSIGSSAFKGNDFSSVIIPQSVTRISSNAFAECFNLTSYTFEGINAPALSANALIPVEAEAEITYPYGGYGYGETFGGLPASSPYTSGTYDSFTYVINQDGTSVKITDYPNRSTELIIPSSINGREVSMIDSNAFSNCYGLTGVSIPNTVTSIGTAAFYGCYGLSTITIGNGVHSIGAYAFQGCSGLQDFIIDADNISLQSIGAVLFNSDLTGLIAAPSISGTYEVPSSVTAIESFAFQSNSAISSVTIASSVTTVGVNAFYGCSNLDDIKFLGVTAPTLSANAFTAVSSGAAVTYPYGGSGYGATFGGLPANEIPGWLVSVGAASGGTTNLAPGAGFEDGTVVSITATPDLGYIFGNWSGDYSGISNPLEFTISQDTSVRPLFYPDYSDADSDGLPAYDELITHGTNPNLPDSNADGVKDGDAVNAGLNPQTDYTDIINYVKLNSHDFDLYTQDSIMDLSLGRVMIQRNTQGSFDLSYEVQTSEDLSTWSTHSSPSVAIEPVGNKEFIRISVE